MSDVEDFIEKYVPDSVAPTATNKLRDLIEKYSGASVITAPSSASAYEGLDGTGLLMIGEEGEYGFYVITGNMRKAIAAAREYMNHECGLDSDYIKDVIEAAEKTRLHLYGKPWEDGEQADWYWYAENSSHEKAEWAVKFRLDG